MFVILQAVRPFISNLAVLGCTQLTDLNGDLTPFQRRYMKDVLRIQEMERKLVKLVIKLVKLVIKF